MLDSNTHIFSLIPALIFFILNVFIPGPNVLNTIATSMGSGRSSGISCALATGLGVFLTALSALFGAAVIFDKVPVIYKGMTVIGGILLLYFAKRYIQKGLSPSEKIIVLKNISNRIAFNKAFLVLMSNPKMMTTWLAVISLFPIVSSDFKNVIIFSLMAGTSSFRSGIYFLFIKAIRKFILN